MEAGLREPGLYGSISAAFGESRHAPQTLSPLTLAFVGDAVWALIFSTVAVNMGNTRNSALHQRTERYVSAQAQARMADYLLSGGFFSEKEQEVFRRGVNARPRNMAKNATSRQYHVATGMEALAGYLYLSGQTDRLIELIKTGKKVIDE